MEPGRECEGLVAPGQDLRAETVLGEQLEQDGVRHPAIQDRRGLDAAVTGVEAGFESSREIGPRQATIA